MLERNTAMNFSSMLTNHPFWGVVTLFVLTWYSTITVYVAIRGIADIKSMLKRLRKNHQEPNVEKKS